MTIRLPLTLAILDGQLVNINQNTYVVPLLSIIETVVVDVDVTEYPGPATSGPLPVDPDSYPPPGGQPALRRR